MTVIQDARVRELIDSETAHFFQVMGDHPTYQASTLFLTSVKNNDKSWGGFNFAKEMESSGITHLTLFLGNK